MPGLDKRLDFIDGLCIGNDGVIINTLFLKFDATFLMFLALTATQSKIVVTLLADS